MEMIPAGAVETSEKSEPPAHGSEHAQSLPRASSIHNAVAPTADLVDRRRESRGQRNGADQPPTPSSREVKSCRPSLCTANASASPTSICLMEVKPPDCQTEAGPHGSGHL